MMSLYPNFSFDIISTVSGSKARLGVLKTPHGEIRTPNFIFCATKATLKSLTPEQIRNCGTQIILSNTYHLMLRPGADLVAKMGGLQNYSGWNGPMFTDSGGFQIFSLGHGSVANEIKGKRNNKSKSFIKITEEGARFKSYLDGTIHLLTPETSIQIQRKLGADLIVVLDECTPYHVDKAYTRQSMYLSHRWAVRSLQEFIKGNDHRQALYGIIQGGIYPDLRKIATEFVSSQPFFGYAIGGSLGADKKQMYEVVSTVMNCLDTAKPVHLLGIGGIKDIFYGVRQGIDSFDCVHPTRLARHGGALVKGGVIKEGDTELSSGSSLGTKYREHISLNNSKFRDDSGPIGADCSCYSCKTFSRSYLHYLLKAQELLAFQAITIHNVTFINELMQDIRTALAENKLDECEKKWLKNGS